MAIVNVQKLELGSILAEDVKDIKGRMLMQAGTEIAERQLQILKAWGIGEVAIVGDAQEDDADASVNPIDPRLEEQINRKIDWQFMHCTKAHPVMHTLVGIVRAKMLKQFQDGTLE